MQITSDQLTSDSPLSRDLTDRDTHSEDNQGYAEYFRLAGIRNVRNAQRPDSYYPTNESSGPIERPAEGGVVL
jgi:hypothetical protein